MPGGEPEAGNPAKRIQQASSALARSPKRFTHRPIKSPLHHHGANSDQPPW